MLLLSAGTWPSVSQCSQHPLGPVHLPADDTCNDQLLFQANSDPAAAACVGQITIDDFSDSFHARGRGIGIMNDAVISSILYASVE